MSTAFRKQDEICHLTTENERLIQEINRLTTKLHQPATPCVSSQKSLFKDIVKSSTNFTLKDSLKVDDNLWRRGDYRNTPETPNAKTSFVSRLSSNSNQLSCAKLQHERKQCNTNGSGDLGSKFSMSRRDSRDSFTTFTPNTVPIEGDCKQKEAVSKPTGKYQHQQKKKEREAATDQSSKEKTRMAERLIGEIAFQLDKRILHSIFSHRKRLYGFSVRNISEKIDEYTRDSHTGAVDIEKRESLRARRDSTMLFLSRAAGYNPKYHAGFAEMLINKYGVLRVVKGKSEREYRDLMNEEYLKSTIVGTVDADSTYDALTLLNSLLAFAKLDGKPMFLW